VNKTTTLKPPATTKPDSARAAQWEEARSVFPIYIALAKQLGMQVPNASAKRNLPEQFDMETFTRTTEWLDSMDEHVQAHQLRKLLQMSTLNASEAGLRALIQRHLRKLKKTNIDRDKIDFLLVQYFALCAPAKIYHKNIELVDVAQVIQPVLGKVDPAPLAWCAPLEHMIEALRGFRSLREILKTNFIEQGRRVKESAGGMFYDPSALLAFIRFNFLLRRTLIELMHADLISIRSGLTQLEAGNMRVIDCQNSGMSQAEPIARIREMANEWKQPFQSEYTERTVTQAFDTLLGLRKDVELALEKVLGKSPEGAKLASTPVTPRSLNVAEKGKGAQPAEALKLRGGERSAPPAEEIDDPAAALDFESGMEQVWEQLIATPPTRGRSMTTVKVGGARILLSSWEVTAFVNEDGPSAEDLRRAVVARVLVTAAMESAKQTGNATSMDRAMNMARVEVTRLQERVEAAKQAKDTEAAVNLGISTKRLLSSIDEAEKL
jgi:hypothetical protein